MIICRNGIKINYSPHVLLTNKNSTFAMFDIFFLFPAKNKTSTTKSIFFNQPNSPRSTVPVWGAETGTIASNTVPVWGAKTGTVAPNTVPVLGTQTGTVAPNTVPVLGAQTGTVNSPTADTVPVIVPVIVPVLGTKTGTL